MYRQGDAKQDGEMSNATTPATFQRTPLPGFADNYERLQQAPLLQQLAIGRPTRRFVTFETNHF